MNPELVLEIEAAAKKAEWGSDGLYENNNILALITEMRRKDAALNAACDWLERLAKHYDPGDTEQGLPEIARLRAALGGAPEGGSR